MWNALKGLFVASNWTRGRAFGVFSILGTIALIYLQYLGNSNKKAEITLLKRDNTDLKAQIVQLKEDNTKQNDVIIRCDSATKTLKELNAEVTNLAQQESVRRAMDNFKFNLERQANEEKINEAFSSQDCDPVIISDDAAGVFDQKLEALQSTRRDRDSDGGELQP